MSHAQVLHYRWFYRLTILGIAMVVLPTLLLQVPTIVSKGMSNAFAGMLAFLYIPLSFVIWQAALVFLFYAGGIVVRPRIRRVWTLNVMYVGSVAIAVGLFFLFPARLY